MISPKNIICNANSLENTEKALKLFRSESGASEIIMYIMYLVMSCKYSQHSILTEMDRNRWTCQVIHGKEESVQIF